MRLKKLLGGVAVTASLLSPSLVLAVSQVDADLPVYQKASGVSGNLSSVGSDTLANLIMTTTLVYPSHYVGR